ncbi:MAG: glycosyltransferase, partial [Chloroflexota bacterium]|nr:glycosyltransferase [Chloroflexota bacterium]
QSPAKMIQDNVRGVFGIPNDVFTLLMFGSIRRNKNYELVMQAICTIEYTVLVIAGLPTTISTEELRQLAERHGISDRVIILPHHQPEARVADLHEAADCAVIPYGLEFTGSSGPLLEALSHGVPVIVSRVGDIGTIVEDAAVGWTFPASDVTVLSQCIQDAIRERGTPAATERSARAMKVGCVHNPKYVVEEMLASVRVSLATEHS